MMSTGRTISLMQIEPQVTIQLGSDNKRPLKRTSSCTGNTQSNASLRDNVLTAANDLGKPHVRQLSLAEVMKHREMDDAWIVVDGEVYDISSFLESHPGGPQVILDHVADGDAGLLMRGSEHPDSHSHSASAFAMLKQFHIGSLQQHPRRKLSTADVKGNSQCKMLDEGFEVDLSKPLVSQVGKLGSRYHDWVHDPIVSKESPRFYKNDFAELLTTTKWWVIPLIFLPVVVWLERDAMHRGNSFLDIVRQMCLGMMTWTFLEYTMHRFLFHMKTSSYWMNTIHYVLHGFHHKHPMDGSRLVFPPALSSIICAVFWHLFSLFMSRKVLPAFFGGTLFGYIIYDLTHYYLHFGRPYNNFGRNMKRYHLNHHFKVQDNAFGITTSMWDKMLGTFPKRKAV